MGVGMYPRTCLLKHTEMRVRTLTHVERRFAGPIAEANPSFTWLFAMNEGRILSMAPRIRRYVDNDLFGAFPQQWQECLADSVSPNYIDHQHILQIL